MDWTAPGRRALEGEEADLWAVAVGDDDLVFGGEGRERCGDPAGHEQGDGERGGEGDRDGDAQRQQDGAGEGLVDVALCGGWDVAERRAKVSVEYLRRDEQLDDEQGVGPVSVGVPVRGRRNMTLTGR
jgi:hypothetical protein